MKIRLLCPVCETPGRAASGMASWSCPACEHVVALNFPPEDPPKPLARCVCCGGEELYRKKDFPHGLGMLILVGAFVTSTVTYLLYLKVLTWVILIGSAAFDGILYLLVGDAVVCYRCHTQHTGVPVDPERHQPFELAIHERYRQEKLRKEEMRLRG